MSAMIDIVGLCKWYGPMQVLSDCTTAVAKGEVVVVCGPSGSGKSTLIKCVNGLEPFQKGHIVFDGVSVGGPKTNLPKLRARIGMVFQHFELFPHLSVMRNLTFSQIDVAQRIMSLRRRRFDGQGSLELLFAFGPVSPHSCQRTETVVGVIAVGRFLQNMVELCGRLIILALLRHGPCQQ